MMCAYPIPGNGIDTAYGISGSSWKTCGYHTGVDFAAAQGTMIYAPISGQCRHRNYGSSFGNHQFVLSPDPGQAFADGEVFFAHTYDRPPDGAYFTIGQSLGAHVGSEGNSTGPHLHFEYHTEKGLWNCSVISNPQIVLDHQEGGGAAPPSGSWTSGDVWQEKLVYQQQDSDSVRRMQTVLNEWPFEGGVELPVSGNYLDQTKAEVAKFQEQVCGDPGDGHIGPKQTDLLFTKLGPWNIIR